MNLWLEATGSIPVRDLYILAFFAAVPTWLGLINVYKFPLDNFHLQYPSTIIESSEIPPNDKMLYKFKNNITNVI